MKQGKDKFRFPVLPAEYQIEESHNNQSTIITAVGEINVIGKRNLRTVTLSSFFPAQKYSFLQYQNIITPSKAVSLFEKMKQNGVLTLIITGSKKISMECTIENFIYGQNDGTGDINFEIELKEYRKIGKSKTNNIPNKTTTKITKPSTKRTTKVVKSQTYIVKKGDTLPKIAKKLTGDSSNYRAIANQNNIKNVNKIKVGQKLVIKV